MLVNNKVTPVPTDDDSAVLENIGHFAVWLGEAVHLMEYGTEEQADDHFDLAVGKHYEWLRFHPQFDVVHSMAVAALNHKRREFQRSRVAGDAVGGDHPEHALPA
jgi:hypothetical protein